MIDVTCDVPAAELGGDVTPEVLGRDDPDRLVARPGDGALPARGERDDREDDDRPPQHAHPWYWKRFSFPGQAGLGEA